MLYVLLVAVILMWAWTIAYLWHLHPSMGGWLATFVFTLFFGVMAYACIISL